MADKTNTGRRKAAHTHEKFKSMTNDERRKGIEKLLATGLERLVDSRNSAANMEAKDKAEEAA